MTPGITVDAAGNVYFSDRENNRIRVVCVSLGVTGAISGSTFVCPSEYGDYLMKLLKIK